MGWLDAGREPPAVKTVASICGAPAQTTALDALRHRRILISSFHRQWFFLPTYKGEFLLTESN